MSDETAQDVLGLLGALALILGLGLWSVALALVVGGAGSLTFAVLWARASRAPRPPQGK